MARTWAAVKVRAEQEDPMVDAHIYTALFEATLVHMRGILEFLRRSGDPRTRSAVSFSTTWSVDSEACAALDDLHKRIHKSLAHLDVNRLRDQSPWLIVEDARRIVHLYESFIAAMDKPGADPDGLLADGLRIAVTELDAADKSLDVLSPDRRPHFPDWFTQWQNATGKRR